MAKMQTVSASFIPAVAATTGQTLSKCRAWMSSRNDGGVRPLVAACTAAYVGAPQRPFGPLALFTVWSMELRLYAALTRSTDPALALPQRYCSLSAR